ncbi:hypothetical protein A3K63_04330 [Candidatus Micrarchaeota archaeon RBG_16_49_10]|nr:MAG: hypothetical protein A3K63_04330 [Candidatus Micrarchaeota archaeon RBG_16_49_10]
MTNKLSWKIGGEAGFGIMTTGYIFSKACVRAGLNTFDFTEFPSLIRGGHNTYQVRVEDREVHSPVKSVDILVALNRQTIELHEQELTPGGAIIYDSSLELERKIRPDVKVFAVPFLDLAKKAGGERLMVNNVALGVSFALVDFDLKTLLKVIEETFKDKGKKVTELNKAAAKEGYDYMRQLKPEFGHRLRKAKTMNRMLISGNEAVALGALKAGCKFIAAYPMTPASGIFQFLAGYEREYGIIAKQTEDEIAAMNMVIGAGFAGVRSMTCTSGGGFSLMVEAVGLAGITETPAVIVEVQRPGPSTGMPTQTGQEDLRFILSSSQGEFPRVVIAPGDVDECFHETINAFNLAERYQIPVFILSDKHLGESRTTTKVFDTRKVRIDRGAVLSDAQLRRMKQFNRYEDTKTGVSPRSIPGQRHGIYTATSNEHGESGIITEESEDRVRMVDKRMRKMKFIEREMPKPHVYGSPHPEITLVCWGSTKGAAMEALTWLLRDHVKVNLLHLVYLNPFPSDQVKAALDDGQKILLIEGNATGQLGGLIRENTGIEIGHRLLKYDGRPIYPEEIYDKVKEVLRHG